MDKSCSPKKKMALGLTIIALSASLALIITELLLRVVNPVMPYAYMPFETYVSYYRTSAFLPFELRPNNRSRFKMLEFDTTVITNSLGLRDNEVDSSEPRILCMGDSFTFGFGVENDETFCAILERLFQGKYDFLNAGFADGYSPDTYALWLSKYGEALSPKSIIVCLSENDLGEVSANTWFRGDHIMAGDEPGLPDRIVKAGHIITDDGTSIRDNFIAKLPAFIRRLIKQSYLVAFLRDRLVHDLDPSKLFYRPEDDRKKNDQKFIRSLEMLRDVAGSRMAAFYLIPVPGQTGSHMDELVLRFAAKHGVPVLSNTGDFSREDYFPLDPH